LGHVANRCDGETEPVNQSTKHTNRLSQGTAPVPEFGPLIWPTQTVRFALFAVALMLLELPNATIEITPKCCGFHAGVILLLLGLAGGYMFFRSG
jgi:hypothetical protein